MRHSHSFTSESVTEGHPDKVCDRIADAILDAHLAGDPDSRVACEVMAKGDRVILAGEIRSTARPDHEAIVRRTLESIGDSPDVRIDVLLSVQSAEIGHAVDGGPDLGAGDQGLMFGYATAETPELMPMPILLAHRLARGLAADRHEARIPWLRPDGKTQVTVRYEDGAPVRVEKILLSTQHAPDVEQPEIARYVRDDLVPRSLGPWHDPAAEILTNPSGSFTHGGPAADCGVTGRKIIVDTYGGAARHGGGAFSGKDPSKVDRSAAYFARFVPREIVRAVSTSAPAPSSSAWISAGPSTRRPPTTGTSDARDSRGKRRRPGPQREVRRDNRGFERSPSFKNAGCRTGDTVSCSIRGGGFIMNGIDIRTAIMVGVLAVLALTVGCDDDPSAPVDPDGREVIDGDVVIACQDHLELFEGVKCITGWLQVGGREIVNLDPLSSLESVQLLSISSTAVSTTEPLSRLTVVEQSLNISRNDSLTSLAGLSGIRSVRSILVMQNRQLRSLEPLTSLPNVAQLSVSYLQRLRHVDLHACCDSLTYLAIGSCDSLTTLDLASPLQQLQSIELCGLPRLESVTLNDAELPSLERLTLNGIPSVPFSSISCSNLDKLHVFGVGAITDFSWLQVSGYLGDVDIHYLNTLESLDGLEGVDRIENLSVVNVPALRDISDLADVNEIGELYLVDCPSLESVEGLSGSYDSCWLRECAIRDLSGIDATFDCGDFRLYGCEACTSLEGMRGVKQLELSELPLLTSLQTGRDHPELESLTIESCSGLTSLEGLSELPALESVSLTDCDRVPDLTGISWPDTVGAIAIRDCDQFSSLTGLENVRAIRYLSIVGNRSLPTADIEAFIDTVSIIEIAIYTGNG